MGEIAEDHADRYFEYASYRMLNCQGHILSPVRLVNETELAYLVHYKRKDRWFPKSQAVLDTHKGKSTLHASCWILERKGLKCCDFCEDLFEDTETWERNAHL